MELLLCCLARTSAAVCSRCPGGSEAALDCENSSTQPCARRLSPSPAQSWVRNPRLDRYFVYTSLLGTHSFFLIFLPMSFWAGNAWFGRG
jgi:hypothetical protein